MPRVIVPFQGPDLLPHPARRRARALAFLLIAGGTLAGCSAAGGLGAVATDPQNAPVTVAPSLTAAPRVTVPPTATETLPPASATVAAPESAPAATVAPAKPGATPAATKPPAAAKPASIELSLTEPVDLDAAIETEVRCERGVSYYMAAAVEVDGIWVEASVDVPAFDGPGDYEALVRVMVSTEVGTQGEEVPTRVTIGSDLGGSAEYVSEGSRGTVVGRIAWTCSR